MKGKSKKFKLDFMPIGQNLKQAREAKGMTRERISEIVDYGPRHIQGIENEGKTPSVDLLFQLAEILEVSLDKFVFKGKALAPCKTYAPSATRRSIHPRWFSNRPEIRG